jgi:predicted rRNA methylase YqxC with S4 and FtsJ domains
MEVPSLEKINLEEFKINPDFDKIYQLLIKQFNFKSLEKTLEELKHIYSTNQLSLF